MEQKLSCKSCGGPTARGNKSGLCRPCRFPPRAAAFCSLCAQPISARQNQSGVCRSCRCGLNRIGEANARRLASLAESNRDPVLNASRAAKLADYARTPAGRRQRSIAGKKTCVNTLLRPDVLARSHSPECKERRRQRQLSTWARKREEKADLARLAAMTPFERAMELVRRGAGISIVRPIRRPEPMFTLGGVSEL